MSGNENRTVTKLPSVSMVLVDGSSGAITLALPTPEISSLPNCVALARPERSTLMAIRSLARIASSLETR